MHTNYVLIHKLVTTLRKKDKEVGLKWYPKTLLGDISFRKYYTQQGPFKSNFFQSSYKILFTVKY